MDDMRNKGLVIFAIVFLLIVAFASPSLITGYTEIKNADAASNAKDYAIASASYAHAADLLPWRKDLWEKAGIAASANGNPSEAIDFLNRASALSEQGWAALGYSNFTTDNIPGAIKAYQQGLQIYDSPLLYRLLALAFRQQKDWAAEREALQNQLRLDKKDAFAHYRLGLLLSILTPEKALPDLMLASSLDPEYDPAVQTLRAALNASSITPDRSKQMEAIGRGLGLVQEWDLSLAAFEKATELNPENAEAWAWFGEAQQQTGGDGRVELDRAVSIDYKSVTVRALRGLYWNRQKKYREMLAEYVLAAQFEPQNPAWQASIGGAYIKLGDLASAFDAYQHATELSPNESTYWRLLATFCAENGVRIEDVGLPAAQKAVELSPTDPAALDILGVSYFSSGRFENAEQTFKNLIKLAPEYLPAHIHIAVNYLSQGNRTAAFNELVYVRDADKDGSNGTLAEQLLDQYFP
jgi:tetratricopeptide (TPR) repeat protein